VDDGAALLAAVREFPAEDTPRLIYADWLEEQGQEGHAAMIRRQVARGATVRYDWFHGSLQLHGYNPPSGWCYTAGRGTRGDSRVIKKLLPDAPELPTTFFRVEFSRGFLSHLECTGPWWLDNADVLAPCCGRLVVRCPPPRPGEEWAVGHKPHPFGKIRAHIHSRTAVHEVDRRPETAIRDLLQAEWPWATFEFLRGQHTN
jgi:uncharacterized protein (TIGR02996 family)